VEWLRVKALSSNPSTEKQTNKPTKLQYHQIKQNPDFLFSMANKTA
jgi:hypothetical protein